MTPPHVEPIGAAARVAIRDVPGFPKPGILFRDITPLLGNPQLFRRVTDAMVDTYRGSGITHAIGIESRGFILAAPMAQALGVAFVPVRKPGKLPGPTLHEAYALEYGADALEMHVDAVPKGGRVLIVDDVLATGGTASAACRLVERSGGVVAGCAFLIELADLNGRKRLDGRTVTALVSY